MRKNMVLHFTAAAVLCIAQGNTELMYSYFA